MKKILIISAFAVIAASFFYFDLHSLLTLDGLKSSVTQFETWYAKSPFLVASIFFLLYVVTTAMSLPGASILTLAAGALFGLFQGVILVSFASTLGASLAFLVSRYLLQETIQSKFGDRLKSFNDGIEKDGSFYLFTLRLVPIFPFFLINLVMGLTKIKLATFYIVSQVGMLAGTIVYVNAGTQLAQLDSPAGILSPSLLLSFALLGLFPWIAKTIVSLVKAKKVYKDFQKPEKFDRNLIVIGGGAGGLVSSYIAAAVKAKVTLIEANKMGGDCLNYGCVPSKALIKSAKIAKQMNFASDYGLESTKPSFSFKKVMARVHDVIRKIEPHDSIERYESLGVEVIQGYGKLVDPWTVEITSADGATQLLTGESIILATGARPFVPPIEGLDDVGYVTSDTLWEEYAALDEIPPRLVVLGGGPIGCELAQSFARLGSKVTQVEMGDHIMAREDVDVSEYARSALEGDGVQVLTGHTAVRCELRDGEKYIVVLEKGVEKEIQFDSLLCAVGRSARLTGYGLEDLGIETNRTIETNEYLETLYPNIFAVGDVAGPYQFTHTAAHQAWFAAVNALFGTFKKFKADYRVIPWVTFTDPEIARVGLSEKEAKAQGIEYEVTRYGLDDLDRAITESADHGFLKVLTPVGKDKILGVTIVGQHSGDIMAEFVLAMKHGLGLNKILGTIHAYPTWTEANKYAAGEWKKAHAPEWVMSWLQKFHARKTKKDHVKPPSVTTS